MAHTIPTHIARTSNNDIHPHAARRKLKCKHVPQTPSLGTPAGAYFPKLAGQLRAGFGIELMLCPWWIGRWSGGLVGMEAMLIHQHMASASAASEILVQGRCRLRNDNILVERGHRRFAGGTAPGGYSGSAALSVEPLR